VTVRWHHAPAHELHVAAATQSELFEAATAAFSRLIVSGGSETPDRMPVLVQATRGSSLIGEFMDDLLYLADVEQFAARRLERIEIDGDRLRAAVSGWTGELELLVGSVEHAGTGSAQADGGWSAMVSFA
jgi:SHS2 domain-containing protein